MSIRQLLVKLVVLLCVCSSVLSSAEQIHAAQHIQTNRPHLRTRTARFFDRSKAAASVRVADQGTEKA